MTANVKKNPLADGADWPAGPTGLVEFHDRMPAYAPTLLFDAPKLAERFGVGRIVIKAETKRMGLPSFKILGASWATYQAICAHIGREPEPWTNITELATNLEFLKPFKLATATDGNHGRAVSYMARLLGFECSVFVPKGMVDTRIRAMELEGSTVTVVDGDYDDAVARAGEEASETCIVVSDTSWPGYETIPAQVVEGYSTIFREVDDALDASDMARPDLVVIPVGVGAFMAAAVTHYRSGTERPIIVGVEPIDANCVQVSALAGEMTHVGGPHESIMVGLNCGLPSMTAWPRLKSGIDWLVATDDDSARRSMRDLAEVAIAAGETGAACLAGFDALMADDTARAELPDLSNATILLVVTEGATDPEAYEEIVGRPPESVGRVITAVT